MQTTNSNAGISYEVDRGRPAAVRTRGAAHPTARARVATAVLLTVIAVALGAAFGVWFGPLAIGLYGFSLPVALCLLWASSDVLRSEEEPREHE